MAALKKRQLSEREKEVGKAALSTLVNQFSNPFDFVRELVQNSLDSGTPSVDVYTDFKKTKGKLGICEVHVDDYGTGMDEVIIDTKLTRLFSSTKEDDLTNIGKFGIGFASVFAINPKGVLVKTGRGGEYWEIFFFEDRTFEKTKLEQPTEGTQITLFVEMTDEEYPQAVKAVKETLAFWCKHATKEVYFTDRAFADEADEPKGTRRRRAKAEPINLPMVAEGYLPVSFCKGETEVSVAFSFTPKYCFYNQGLTLLETESAEVIDGYQRFFGYVSFKVKSPHLEHTLTRDTIRRDANFHKVMLSVVEMARGPLIKRLLDRLEELASVKKLDMTSRIEYRDALLWLFSIPKALDPTFGTREKIGDLADSVGTVLRNFRYDEANVEVSVDAAKRKIFRRCDGGATTLHELGKLIKKSRGIVLLSQSTNKMTRELTDSGIPVFLANWTPEAKTFFKNHLVGKDYVKNKILRVEFLSGKFFFFKNVKASDMSKPELDFTSAIGEYLFGSGLPIKELRNVNFLGDHPRLERISGTVVTPSIIDTSTGILDSSKELTVGINVQGVTFKKLSRIYEVDPDMAVILTTRKIINEIVDNDSWAGELRRSIWNKIS